MSEKFKRLGIYGGSFSPIHSGHVKAAQAFLEAMELDRLLIMPSGLSPHKPKDPFVSGVDKLNMCRLAFCGDESYLSGKLSVSDFEVSRGGKSYTVYTLEHFASQTEKLYLLVGTDMFFTLSKWFRAEDIFRLADIVLMRRENDPVNTPLIKKTRAEYESLFGARIHEIDEPPIVISSTELREKLEAGQPFGEFVPAAVENYIKKNNLYIKRLGM